jgi:hypothetical protein
MTDVLMLLVSLVGFGGLVIGWMALPDSPKTESAPVSTAARVAEAA